VHALGPYRVVADGRALQVSLSEAQVRGGALLSLPAPDTNGSEAATHETPPPL
jgi:hypothetical protein